MRLFARWTSWLVLPCVLMLRSAGAADGPIRVGIIGLDTSHVTAFTNGFKKAGEGSELAGVQVVAAYPGGSPDVDASRTRIAGFTQKLKDGGVEIVDSVEALLPKVDAILLESCDGRPHLKQARIVFAANEHAKHKLPMFIDKPIAASLADVLEIFRLAEASGTPCFTSSSLRYDPAIVALHDSEKYGSILGCDANSPCALEPHHPDLFWYGIHGVETLFTVMGPGCETVSCAATKETHFATGVWKDGRIGTFRGLRAGKEGYGVFVYGTKANGPCEPVKAGYDPLLAQIAKFFRTGKPPVSAAETIELVAFMQAASDSLQHHGEAIKISDVIAAARQENEHRK
ncbi:MAG TPA: gfo/Idh/MocA family oxidoreductase [Pirellulales bacterium]|jgi:predicted dehydrogenase|nr:gfo/Idh/MocA family oxidoreductase [Pirellulales bacterium]